MDFAAHWKNWLRPLASVVYFILMMIAIPLCVIELTNDSEQDHVKAWFTGGVFVLLAVPISLWEIINHVINYTQPHLQKYIIRIIWMVPIYALNAWFALRFKKAAIYLDTIRECYEAYVIYNFMAYLLSFLYSTHPQLSLDLSRKPQQKHLIPFCLLPPWKMGSKMIDNCKHGVLQYTIVRPLTTIIALICQLNHKYDEGDFNFKSAWSYIVIINNISQIWAMYCLVLFYQATKDMLTPIKPIPKFLCVKFVVFFSFWQSVVIAALAKFDLIPYSEFYGSDVKDVSMAIQDFCICVEMFIAAIAHYLSFSHKPFINPEADMGNCCVSFVSMWDVSDVKNDVVEHAKYIGTTMKKTVSGPFRPRPTSTEATPLLQSASAPQISTATDTYMDGPQVTKADVHTSSYQNQSDVMSTTSDWEVTSVDRWKSPQSVAKSTTASMNNYLDNQSMQSQGLEHSIDTDSVDNKHPGDADSKRSKLGSESDSVKGDNAAVSESDSVKGDNTTSDDSKALIDFDLYNDSSNAEVIAVQGDVVIRDSVEASANAGEREDSIEVDRNTSRLTSDTDAVC